LNRKKKNEEKTLPINQIKKDIPENKTGGICGKQGARYTKYCAFSIQPQNYPNAINIVSN
jgi:hypothetical protein